MRESFVLFWEFRLLPGYPPPPRSSEIIDLRGDDRQNLLLQRVRGKILRTKELTHFCSFPAAFALAMICLSITGRKVRCHNLCRFACGKNLKSKLPLDSSIKRCIAAKLTIERLHPTLVLGSLSSHS